MSSSEEEGDVALTEDSPDFSQPWLLSDVVLVVEEKKFHVHRSMLAMWSPVFAKMFTTQFREETADEIPLPAKKADEINEMLAVIYPTFEREVDKDNYVFLLKLSKEYMMTKLTKKCESFLIKKFEDSHCLEYLDVAQAYELRELEGACIEKAKSESLDELTSHRMYEEINYSNYKAIVEVKIREMEKELMDLRSQNEDLSRSVTRLKDHGKQALQEFENMISVIAFSLGHTEMFENVNRKLNYIRKSEGVFAKLYRVLNCLFNSLRYIQ